jgi:predicted metal-binding membrane protein
MALRVNIVRAEVVVIAALLGLAALAWFFTDLEMAGMDAGPGTDPGAFGFYTATWVLMMAAMMFPSLAPMVVVLRRLERRRPAPSLTTPLFAIGYLAVWTASGIVAYAALKAGRAWTGDVFAWHRAGQALAGAALSLAAAYEFTPLKTKCLRKCRSPFAFLTNSWQDGPAGALSMGARHGAWCLGCCWALMLALFALGAMSLTWMALLAALIAAEKLLPWRRIAIAAVAAVLVALGTGVAVAPADVPGLTLPGGMSSASAMDVTTQMETHQRLVHVQPCAFGRSMFPSALVAVWSVYGAERTQTRATHGKMQRIGSRGTTCELPPRVAPAR